MLEADVAWSQMVGSREGQQDTAAVLNWPNGFRLMILADGMGGHKGGDVASGLVVETAKKHFIESSEENFRDRLIDALETANLAIYNEVKTCPELSGMGTTFIAVIFDGVSIQWISVGDSPLWLHREGNLERINENHSMATVLAEKVEAGELTREEASLSPDRSQLLEAVLGENIEMLDAPKEATELLAGDTLIMASDGVESCSEQQLVEIINKHEGNAESLATEILQAVEKVKRPKQDNATLIVMCVLPGNDDPDTLTPSPEDVVTLEPRTG